MAIGAVFLSVPTALAGTLYLTMQHGLSTAQGVALYALLGLLVMTLVTIVNGLLVNDLE